MPLISYQAWKAAKVESGECTQTIRPDRVYPVKVGDRLHQWQQQRSKYRRKLGQSNCTIVTPIVIKQGHIYLNGENTCLPDPQAQELAIADGFESLEAFLLFFQKEYKHDVFTGTVIKWDILIPHTEDLKPNNEK